jgi:hypothetical protein
MIYCMSFEMRQTKNVNPATQLCSHGKEKKTPLAQPSLISPLCIRHCGASQHGRLHPRTYAGIDLEQSIYKSKSETS